MVDEEFDEVVWRVFEMLANPDRVRMILIDGKGAEALALPDEAWPWEEAVKESRIHLIVEFNEPFIRLILLVMLPEVFEEARVKVHVDRAGFQLEEFDEKMLQEADENARIHVLPGSAEAEADLLVAERCRGIIRFEPAAIGEGERVGAFTLLGEEAVREEGELVMPHALFFTRSVFLDVLPLLAGGEDSCKRNPSIWKREGLCVSPSLHGPAFSS